MPTNLLRILFASACLSTLLYIIELAVVGITHIYLLIAFFVFLLATHVSPEREIRAKVPPIRSLGLLLHHFWNTARPWVGSVSVGTKIHWLAHVEHSLGTVGAIACAGTDILLRIGLATVGLKILRTWNDARMARESFVWKVLLATLLSGALVSCNTLLMTTLYFVHSPVFFSIQGEIYTFNLLALFCTAISETNEGAADSESALEFQVASRGGCNTEEEQPRSGPV
ncbi:hypothetical protein B0H14DRAFT_2612427 [Mycena olivaceomarginata]|nr:hypothetical protein B0H14DRAFT_2612427 [Mycena olivaceomarginata]